MFFEKIFLFYFVSRYHVVLDSYTEWVWLMSKRRQVMRGYAGNDLFLECCFECDFLDYLFRILS